MKETSAEKQKMFTDLFSRAPIKKTFGMEFHYDEQNRAVFTMPYHPGFDHALNQVHGGVLATLLDNAGWFTVAQYYGTWIATAEMQMRLIEPVEKERLISKGNTVKLGNKLAMAEMRVENSSGKLVALGTGTFAVTSISISG